MSSPLFSTTSNVTLGGSITLSADPSSGATLTSGRSSQAITGTPQKVSVASVPCKSVLVTADSANLNEMVVGSSTVNRTVGSKTGTILQANEKVAISVTDVSLLYQNGQAGDALTFTALNT